MSYNQGMKYGLVLEGGAMRGMYTMGVLDAFMDEKISFDGIIGVSAGAVFGANFPAGQRGRVIRYSKRFNGDWHYMGFRSLLLTGNLINTDFAYRRIPRELDPADDEAYMKAGVPFYVVVTNLEDGKPEYVLLKSIFDQIDLLRASASMPFFAKPVELDGKLYLDGGVADSIPWRKMLELGYERLVVVLTRDRTYVKEPMSRLPVKLKYGKYPAFAEDLYNRHIMYNDSLKGLAELEKEGRAFVIRPSEPVTIDRIERDPEKLQALYDEGMREAKERLGELKEFLKG